MICCRICLNSSKDNRSFFDEHGDYDTELYYLTGKYFDTEFLSEDYTNQSPVVVCFKCWHNMSEFNNFQLLVTSLHKHFVMNGKRLALVEGNCKALNTLPALEIQKHTNSDDAILNLESYPADDDDHALKSIKTEPKCTEDVVEYAITEIDIKPTMLLENSVAADVCHYDDGPGAEFHMHDGHNQDTPDTRDDLELLEDLNASNEDHIANDLMRTPKSKELHDDPSVDPNLNKCVLCDQFYSKSIGFHAHYRDVHNAVNSEKCKICGKQVQNLYLHVRTVHQKIPLKTCNPRYKRPFRKHEQHEGANHNDQRSTKDDDAKLLEYQEDDTTLEESSPSKTAVEPRKSTECDADQSQSFECVICGQFFATNTGFYAHYRNVHEKLNLEKCSICGREVKNMYLHIKDVHQKLRQKQCTLCDRTLFRSLDLEEHIADHKGIMLYQCSFCPQSFTFRARAYRHLKSRHPEEVKASARIAGHCYTKIGQKDEK